jgi:kynurenine formamidase
MRIIDLSVPIAPDLPCGWPGLPPFHAVHTLDLEPDNVFSRSLTVEEHLGTHADAPNHIADEHGGAPASTTIDEVPLERFVGPALVLDVRHVRGGDAGVSPWIEPREVEELERAQPGALVGTVLLVRTGWSDEYYRPSPAGNAYVLDAVEGRAPGWPALHPYTITRAVDLGVTTIGVDAPSLGAAHDPLPPHRAALTRGIGVVENLRNLGQVPTGSTFVFLPLYVVGGSGAPGRAVALARQ